VQLIGGDEIALGSGKAELLGHIARAASISAAAKAMGMSYRRTWLLVDAMNRRFREPLVETHPGGGATAAPGESRRGKGAAAYAALLDRIEEGAGAELTLPQEMVRSDRRASVRAE
jgi:molybdate transport system regulatory protein